MHNSLVRGLSNEMHGSYGGLVRRDPYGIRTDPVATAGASYGAPYCVRTDTFGFRPARYAVLPVASPPAPCWYLASNQGSYP